jgi:spore coat protein U-like protein
MKRARLLLLVLTLALGFATVLYAATTTTTLQVAAVVQSAVAVSTSPVNFGHIDPAVSHTAFGSVFVTMPVQQPYRITLNNGSNFSNNTRNMSSQQGPGTISYQLFQPGQTTEWGDSGLGNTYPAGLPLEAIGNGMSQGYSVIGVTQPSTSPITSGTFSDQVQVTVHF